MIAVFTMRNLSLENYNRNIREFTSRMYSFPEVQIIISPTKTVGVLQRANALRGLNWTFKGLNTRLSSPLSCEGKEVGDHNICTWLQQPELDRVRKVD